MDVLTPVITGGLLAVFTLVLTVLGKSQFDALCADIAALRSDMGVLRSDMGVLRDEIAAIRSEMAVMRSDLTHVALAVGAKPQTG